MLVGVHRNALEDFEVPEALVEILDDEGFTRLGHVNDAPEQAGHHTVTGLSPVILAFVPQEFPPSPKTPAASP